MMNLDDAISITEYQTLAEFRYQLRRFLRFSEQAARAAGLEPQQHHSTVELVDRLVERGFIQRSRDEADQRKVLVTLTPQGEEVLRNLSLSHRDELLSIGPALVQALNSILNNTNNT